MDLTGQKFCIKTVPLFYPEKEASAQKFGYQIQIPNKQMHLLNKIHGYPNGLVFFLTLAIKDVTFRYQTEFGLSKQYTQPIAAACLFCATSAYQQTL